jgi:hypothetical protein
MSLMEQIERLHCELDARHADPWKRTLERDLRGVEAMSTVALLDLLGLPATTANARRLARTMRSMGWVGLKSRKLVPGGVKDTISRGWARPIRGRLDRPSAAVPSDRN